MSHATMTLNLPEKEMLALDEMAESKDLSKTGTIRQALRMLQYVDGQLSLGRELAFVDSEGKVHRMVVVGCGGE